MKKIGQWTFIIGILIALIVGFINFNYSGLLLVVLGLITGFLNVSDKETVPFLVSSLAIGPLSTASLKILLDAISIGTINSAAVVSALLAFIGAAAVVVAIKSIYATAKN